MRFLANGGVPDNRPLQITLVFTLLYLALTSAAGILIFAEKIGFTPSSAAEYYLGSEEGFKNPVSFFFFFEGSHMHLFAYAIGLLLLNHLATFTKAPKRLISFLVFASFSAGALDIASGWLIRFVSPYFSYLKIASFIFFQVFYLALLSISIFSYKIYSKR